MNYLGSSDIIKLNVGGKIFQTTKSTICKYPSSRIAQLVQGDNLINWILAHYIALKYKLLILFTIESSIYVQSCTFQITRNNGIL